MTPELAIDIFKQVITFALYVVAPFLLLTLLVGLLTSLFQSVTSLQEQTLSFAPKLVVLAVAFLVLAPWLVRSLTEFTLSFLTRMGTLGH